METIKAAVIAACGVSAGMWIVENMITEAKSKVQIRFMLNMIMLLAVTAPFVKGGMGFSLPSVNTFDLGDYDYSREQYAQALKTETEKNISQVLMEQVIAAGISCEKIETQAYISEDFSISIIKVTVTAEDYEAAARVIRSSIGTETEVVNGSD